MNLIGGGIKVDKLGSIKPQQSRISTTRNLQSLTPSQRTIQPKLLAAYLGSTVYLEMSRNEGRCCYKRGIL